MDYFHNQKGALPLLVLVALFGLILFIGLTSFASFNDKLFKDIYEKKNIFASNPVSTPPPVSGPLDPNGLVYYARLQGVQEVPSTNSSATGMAQLVLSSDKRTAKVSMSFSGLTSSQISAHIHGPSQSGTTAGIMYNLPQGDFTDYQINLSTQQETYLRDGLLYANVHTSQFGNGEIRGQFVRIPNTQILSNYVGMSAESGSATPNAFGTVIAHLMQYESTSTDRTAHLMLEGSFQNLLPNKQYQISVALTSGSGSMSPAIIMTDSLGRAQFGGAYLSSWNRLDSPIVSVKLYDMESFNRSLTGTYFINYPALSGDIDGNYKVDIFDYNFVVSDFSRQGFGLPTDLISNNKVDVFDYNIVITNFGKTAPKPSNFPGGTVIKSLVPQSGAIGTTVEIIGNGFGTSPGSVSFVSGGSFGHNAQIVSWSDTSVQVRVPSTVPTNQFVEVGLITSISAYSNRIPFFVN